MLGNSLAGVYELFGETVTARVIADEAYDTASGTVNRQLDDVTWEKCRLKMITASDRRRMGTALVKETTALLCVIGDQVSDDSIPTPRMKIVIRDQTFEILRVGERSLRGQVVSYECQLAGR